MTDSAFGLGDERLAERCLGKTIIDLHPGAAVLHFAGRSGLERHAKIVQSAGSGQSGIERSIENIVAVEQKAFHMFQSQALQKVFGGDAGPGREETVKMKRTQPGGGSEPGEIGLLGMMSIQKPDHVCDSFVITHTVSVSPL